MYGKLWTLQRLKFKIMKPTVTIGISALNEEANIRNLLEALIVQKGDFSLEKIIVVSDGSTDNTVKLSESVNDPRILTINGAERKGKAHRQNEICQLAQSDILVIVDADTLPENDSFIAKLIEPIVQDEEIGFTSGPNISRNPKNFFEKTLVWGLDFKADLFESMRPDNIFLCVGADRAFRKELYKKLHWPEGYPEDGFSYLASISLGFKFRYQKSARVIFRVPDNFKDHLKQSRRFINSTYRLKKHFNTYIVDSNYHIPKGLFLWKMLKYFMKNPIYATSYGFICLYPRITKPETAAPDLWEMAGSTKKVV